MKLEKLNTNLRFSCAEECEVQAFILPLPGNIRLAAWRDSPRSRRCDPKQGQEVVGLAKAVFSQLSLWAAHAKQRRDLQKLDDRLLNDLGLSRYDVALESRKWFWQ